MWSAARRAGLEPSRETCNELMEAPGRTQRRSGPACFLCAKAALAEIWNAEDREHAEAAARSFVAEYGTKWPKAVAKITDDLDVLLEVYNYPASTGSTCVPRTRSSRPSPPSAFGSGSPRGPDRGRPAWRWRSSSSSPPSNGGVPSTHPTSSLSSGPEPGSRKASWSNVPTNQEAISKSHDTPIPPVLTIAHVLVKVLQTSVDDEKSFGVMSNPSLPVRRMGEPGLNRSMGPIPGRREGAQR